MRQKLAFMALGAAIVLGGLWLLAAIDSGGIAKAQTDSADDGLSPRAGAPTATQALSELDYFYPGTEEIAPNEMRVFACGTGMPNARPSQAAACFLVELGNGDKFVFDAGLGSAERLSTMLIPYDYLDKVFLGHLHVDHIGDLDAFWIGGSIANRQRPLRIWGPAGSEDRYGTAYMVARMQEMYSWDVGSRLGNVNTQGLEIEVHEFDYTEVAVVYEENGVTITAIPAVHGIDGSVSFILEWNDLKFAFSSDTYPNSWWMEHARGADLAIHECFATPSIMANRQGFPVGDALNVTTQVHTSPAQFGRVMSDTQPRLAVGYHFFNDFDTQPLVAAAVESTYDGEYVLAKDYMIFNVTPDDIRVRMTIYAEDVWPQPSIYEKLPADPSQRLGFSDIINGGRVVYTDTIQQIYDETNAEFGTDYPPPN